MATGPEKATLVPRIGPHVSVSVIRIISNNKQVVQGMGYDHTTEDQLMAVESFIDVFLCLPTGSGKSSCYTCLPHVFDELRCRTGQCKHHSIVLVVSPLSSLMQDQVSEILSLSLSVCLSAM